MITCEVCGSENFEKHAGFLYCSVCQTQSQDYCEQEYEYRDHELSTIRRKKSLSRSSKLKRENFCDDGFWTTWEAFNYILFGMTEEMKKCGVTMEFEKMVFKLWAAYLKECQAVFISKYQEKIPKLGFNFKHRDARILYNMDTPSKAFRNRTRTRSRSCNSRISCTTNSTVSSQSKRFAAVQRGKIIAADYQELLSVSMQSNSNLANETLDSLGKTSDSGAASESMSESESLISSFKEMLRKNDYKLYKSSYQSQQLLISAKAKCKRDVRFPGKNKLLSIIHLALLMTGSHIQLSDLLRFIREGHLSFAKVTHFFPKDMKLPKNDFSYIEVTSDSLMPTHLRQRKITSQLACLLKIDQIPTANMNMLIDRYCQELNLPDEIAKLGKKVVRDCVPPTVIPRSKTPFPSYEAWAMASIVFVMKLLLGLNDRTEIFLSHLAREVNGLGTGGRLLFVFEDWQKYIECRKSVLLEFHYPTVEQLGGSPFQSSGKFLDVMTKESKDEYRKERFVPYSKYYIESNLLDEMKAVLNALSKPQHVANLEFQPSLTPQISHLETIKSDLLKNGVSEGNCTSQTSKFPDAVLSVNFNNCSLEFTFDPKSYTDSLKEKKSFFEKFGIDQNLVRDKSSPKNELNILLECSSTYWMLKYPNLSSSQLGSFREEVFEKTPKNFQWLMTECARMLEMNVRDVYDELLRLEKRFS